MMRQVCILLVMVVGLISPGRAESPPANAGTGVPLPAPPTEDPFAPPAAGETAPTQNPSASSEPKGPPPVSTSIPLKPLNGPPVTVTTVPSKGDGSGEGAKLMKALEWEALPTGEDWRSRWYASDFGWVTVVPAPLSAEPLRGGVVLPWKNSNQGAPEVVLRAVVHIPDLSMVKLTDTEIATDSVAIDIRQYVTLFPTRESWKAVASPYYVLLEGKDSTSTLLPLSAGQGAWTSSLGPGGLVVKNFIEGGLGAARVALVRRFRDEEIQRFLASDSDVDFYLRPKN